jgi:hypothetical protein
MRIRRIREVEQRKLTRAFLKEHGIESQVDFKVGMVFKTPRTQFIITDIFFNKEQVWVDGGPTDRFYKRRMVSYTVLSSNFKVKKCCTQASNLFFRKITGVIPTDQKSVELLLALID